MLTQAQRDEYERVGAIVVPEVLSAEEVAELRSVTDGFVERARGLSAHDAIYDLEDSHSAEAPRVRRIKAPHLHHAAYAALVRHPGGPRSPVGGQQDRAVPRQATSASFLALRRTSGGQPIT